MAYLDLDGKLAELSLLSIFLVMDPIVTLFLGGYCPTINANLQGPPILAHHPELSQV